LIDIERIVGAGRDRGFAGVGAGRTEVLTGAGGAGTAFTVFRRTAEGAGVRDTTGFGAGAFCSLPEPMTGAGPALGCRWMSCETVCRRDCAASRSCAVGTLLVPPGPPL
jgi:hypothetical protein